MAIKHCTQNKFQSLTPSSTEIQRSVQVLEHIASAIQNQNSISFARFMQLALYTPGLGYYDNADLQWGKQGDFITAPELSSAFTHCLATQVQEILKELKNGIILECGAGSGKMAADLLQQLSEKNALPTQYLILETSNILKKRQYQNLTAQVPHLMSCVHWIESPPQTPWQGIVIANEMLDALPSHRFHIENNIIYECRISLQENQLVWHLVPTQKPEFQTIFASQTWSNAYTSELNLYIEPFISQLSQHFEAGVMLFIDYGYPQHEYYHPDRDMGTLVCYYKHHANTNPLWYPGIQDISTHVNFSTVARAAENNHLEIMGYATQAHFLLNLGLLSCTTASPQIMHILSSPTEMGENIKVMALGRKFDMPLQGLK